ncbi:methyltransferase [Methylococcus sp. EFPC2]|uniref:methyltransferase n=1 Tax=Methylococcus sp. EFPC2 TaxID=2812648 RepID=UPI0019672B5F|nr:methyltransferase [Methylococcus sp. EFPC2]QSA98188.1 hypothetical protein JWZ97_05055 [Methylococcus sp. EFPC2]
MESVTIVEEDVRRYLCVDEFMQTLVDARALQSAFELGVIDALLKSRATPTELAARLDTRPAGLAFLLDLLSVAGVIEQEEDGRVRLSGRFMGALEFRELLETKLDFAGTVLPDFAELFTLLIARPEQFMRRSRTFNLFRYDRCFDPSPDNYHATRNWMRYTTALTRYEARACLRNHDFSPYRRLLDIGGNSGEFAFRICEQHPDIEATVFDLPLVCDIGAEHLKGLNAAGRVNFVKGDLRCDPLPGGQDAVTFKSFLHDWPESLALQFLAKAAEALRPGGTMVIFERASLRVNQAGMPYSMIPNLLFLHFFRDPRVYGECLKRLGFESVEIKEIELEMPFNLVTATKRRHG